MNLVQTTKTNLEINYDDSNTEQIYRIAKMIFIIHQKPSFSEKIIKQNGINIFQEKALKYLREIKCYMCQGPNLPRKI